jgi:hypothetical protein
MAKKQQVVNFKPIKVALEKAEKTLNGLKKKVAPADAAKLDSKIKLANTIKKDIANLCRGRMTVPFSLVQGEERKR